jgi:KTSC domain
MAGPQVQLPAGYQDAAPVTVKLPPGFEDAAPAQASATPQASEPSLYDRMSSRIKQNFDFGTQIKNVADQVSQAILDAKSGRAFAPGVHRLPEVLNVLKKTYSDPTNVLGDIMSGLITHQATVEMPAAPTPAGPTGPPSQWGERIPTTPAPEQLNPSLGSPEQESALGRLRNLIVPERGVDPGIRPSIERITDEPSTSPQSAKARLEALLNEGLGGKPLEQGVALKNQGAKLPQGFTPLESSALKGYKYDPGASEFQAISQNGQHYIYGDVSPEQAESFANSNSKGQAWNNLRQSSPLVAKVINGKRVAVARTGQSAAP